MIIIRKPIDCDYLEVGSGRVAFVIGWSTFVGILPKTAKILTPIIIIEYGVIGS